MLAGVGVDTGFGFSTGAGSLAPLKMYAKLRSRNATMSFSWACNQQAPLSQLAQEICSVPLVPLELGVKAPGIDRQGLSWFGVQP